LVLRNSPEVVVPQSSAQRRNRQPVEAPEGSDSANPAYFPKPVHLPALRWLLESNRLSFKGKMFRTLLDVVVLPRPFLRFVQFS
jgi:hypothetical protein